jgi:hypothetical protein
MPTQLIGWVAGILVLTVAILNFILVHPVPGAAYLVLSLVYFPPANAHLKRLTGFTIPTLVKLLLGIVLFFFTFGVSDLGDMIDKL